MSAIVDTEKEKEKLKTKEDKAEPATVLELLEEDDEFEVLNHIIIIYSSLLF